MKHSFSMTNRNKRDRSARSPQSHEALKRVLAFCLCALFVISAVPVGLHFASADDNLADASTTLNSVDAEETTTASEDTTTADEDTTEPTSADASATEPASQAADAEDNSSANGVANAPVQAPAKIDLDDGDTVDSLSNATVAVRVNNVDITDSVSVKPGLISSNQAEAVQSIKDKLGNAQYIKTVIRKADGTETEVFRVAGYNGATYYSLYSYDDTGVKLKDGESIILVYADILNVNCTILPSSVAGTATYPSTVNRGDQLTVQLNPAQDYKITTVTYTTPDEGSAAATVENNVVKIDTSNLTGDIQITVNCEMVSSYTIKPDSSMWTKQEDGKDWEDNGHGGMARNRFGLESEMSSPGTQTVEYWGKYHWTNRLYDMQQKVIDLSDTTKFPNIYTATSYSSKKENSGEYLMAEYYYRRTGGVGYPDAYVRNYKMCDLETTPGSNAQFLVYSQSYKGSTTWVLTTLTINNETINVPGLNVGDSATTQMEDGTKVTVTYVLKDEGLYWQDDDVGYGNGKASWDKKRSFYLVTIEDVHKDYNVKWYFQDASAHKIAVVGKRGIAKVASSVENRTWQAGSPVGYHYYYTVTDHNTGGEDEAQDVFVAYNEEDKNNQLIIYATKPGYNPYTVQAMVSYDGGPYTNDFKFTSVTGSVEEVLYSAGGRTNTRYRHWGRSTSLRNTADTYNKKTLLLTSLQTDASYNGYNWFGIAMNNAVDSSKNFYTTQRLLLNATPYKYHAEYDLNGGKLLDIKDLTSNFVVSDGGATLTDNSDPQTVENEDPSFTLPIGTPVKDGYIFQGWQLVQKETAKVTIYQDYTTKKYYTVKASSDSESGYVKDQEFATEEEARTAAIKNIVDTKQANGWSYSSDNDVREETPGGERTEEVEKEDGSTETVTTVVDTSISYTLSFFQPTGDLYAGNDKVELTEELMQYAFGNEKTDDGMSFTFRAKYLSQDQAENTEVSYEIYTEVSKDTTGTDEYPVVEKNGKYYQRVFDTVEVQLVGETVVLNQYKPTNAEYYTYNTDLSKVVTTTVKMTGTDIPETNKLYVYYDYQYQTLTLDEDTRGDYANYLKDFDITITLSKDDLSPIEVPAAGTKVSYGDIEFTSDGTELTATVKMSKATSQKEMVIPYGWNYKVEGATEDGYELTYEDGASNTGENTGNLTTDRTVMVVYTKTDITPTGVLESTVFQASALGAVILIGGTLVGIKVFRRKRNG